MCITIFVLVDVYFICVLLYMYLCLCICHPGALLSDDLAYLYLGICICVFPFLHLYMCFLFVYSLTHIIYVYLCLCICHPGTLLSNAPSSAVTLVPPMSTLWDNKMALAHPRSHPPQKKRPIFDCSLFCERCVSCVCVKPLAEETWFLW